MGIGATILNKNRFINFSEENKNLLLQISKKYHKKLIASIREKNAETIDLFKDRGIKIVPVPRREKQKWNRVSVRVQNQFIGELYPKELLDQIKTLKQEYQNRRPE